MGPSTWKAPLPQRASRGRVNTNVARLQAAASEDDAEGQQSMDGVREPETERKKELKVENILNARIDGDTSLDETIYKLVELRNHKYGDIEPLYNPIKPKLGIAPPPPLKKKREREGGRR